MFKDDELHETRYCENCLKLQQELQEAMDNYVNLDLSRVKEYNELVDKYKAKEQECEKLKSDLTDLSKIIDCKNGTILTFKEQLYQLKAENDTLRQFLSKEPLTLQALQSAYSSYKKSADVFYEMVKQYKQTLTEIKEIINDFAKQDILTFPDLKPKENYKLIQNQCGEPIIQILQKISECEVGK